MNIPGNGLLSHKVSLAVPSALEGLTSVFGMGTGVAPPLRSPGSGLEYLATKGTKLRLSAVERRRMVRTGRTSPRVNFMVKPHGRLVPVS